MAGAYEFKGCRPVEIGGAFVKMKMFVTACKLCFQLIIGIFGFEGVDFIKGFAAGVIFLSGYRVKRIVKSFGNLDSDSPKVVDEFCKLSEINRDKIINGKPRYVFNDPALVLKSVY